MGDGDGMWTTSETRVWMVLTVAAGLYCGLAIGYRLAMLIG